MEVAKSTRYQAIIGRFGEYFICNWLSRSGFEVTLVDHTGIDIVAFNPSTRERLGSTVKSRTRNAGAERDHLNLFLARDREKVTDACKAFACEPWIAVYVETATYADVFLLSLEHYDSVYRGKRATKVYIWSMRLGRLEQYKSDPMVRHLHIDFTQTNWWSAVASRRGSGGF